MNRFTSILTPVLVSVGKPDSKRKPTQREADLDVRADGYHLTQGELPFEPRTLLVLREREREREIVIALDGGALRAIVEHGVLELAEARAEDVRAVQPDESLILLGEQAHGRGDLLAAAALFEAGVRNLRVDLADGDVDDLVEAARKIESYRVHIGELRTEALTALLPAPSGGGGPVDG
jgi:hypothetical protein